MPTCDTILAQSASSIYRVCKRSVGFTFCSDTIILHNLWLSKSLSGTSSLFRQIVSVGGFSTFCSSSIRTKKKGKGSTNCVFLSSFYTAAHWQKILFNVRQSFLFLLFFLLSYLSTSSLAGGRSQENLLDLFLYTGKYTTGPCTV